MWFFIAQVASLGLVLAVLYRPLGDYMARIYTTRKDLKVERGIYRLIGVDPASSQTWQAYARAVLGFSLVGVLLLYGLQRLQEWLPLALGLGPVAPGIAFNTAVSFVTNTNWQSYAGESTMGYLVQAAGLGVQNFASAAVGLAVAVTLIRALAARRAATLGNFWVDLIRGIVRLLLPLSIVAAVLLLASGVIQNFNEFTHITTLVGGTQSIPGGPVASQEAIKLLGTNGGGFFNVNSAHPFENPTPLSNLFECVLMLVIPFSLTRTFGVIVGNKKQGYTILAVMAGLFLISLTALTLLEYAGAGSGPQGAGAAMEGKEMRFGIGGSTLFGTSSTLTSTGAVNSMFDSFTALGGMLPLLNMMLGEVAPGGVGSGLYGMLVLAIITVFIAGLLVGRTPEYLGKKIGAREIKLVSLYLLITPTLILSFTALSFAIAPVRAEIESVSMLNPGPHGFSEVLYAFTSAANNNGSAFAGLSANTPWLNTTLGITMLLGRFLPMLMVLALAGALAAQDRIPVTAGTLPTHKPQFSVLLGSITLIVTALTFFPVLVLGPLAEGLR
ncbi:potassium-transporting ATPase subunit KdpA [Arthrobacter sp. MYb227]|uniref:potassium-transporting ATPase subunit KdpA n=1 Tax=Arthrobacter sp. MYb227 TaxID=1848601 RepID=UPI000CFDF065|nr:potassium-transporting ATPase subunit KdpA [Arthrobacter sp. MYb227]PQZ95064.1 potassium-transporting ATPase subunit KdpA [Arthrobacter sp. MYb227]